MKTCLSVFLAFISLCLYAQPVTRKSTMPDAELRIRQTLAAQTAAWNNGSLDSFMIGYWKNDSLMFIGKSGITYGWQKTLENYRKGYPDRAAMGQLKFDILVVKQLSPEYVQVVGKWALQRSIGDVGGHFTLLFQLIEGNWVVVTDHSS